MGSEHVDIWELRYRDLEQQIEYLLINIADSLSSQQIVPTASVVETDSGTREPKILKVVKSSSHDQAYVYCVANGSNMEYRFEFFANKQSVQDSGFTRLNSAVINNEFFGEVDTCRVTVKADQSGKRRELTAHREIKW